MSDGKSRIRTITMKQFPFKPSGMFFGGWRPGVFKNENGTFGIRVCTGESWYRYNQTYRWDYFALDETGLITASPRGFAKEYNRRVRIADIAEVANGLGESK